MKNEIVSNTVILAEVLEMPQKLLVHTIESLMKKGMDEQFFIPSSIRKGSRDGCIVYKITEKGMDELGKIFTMIRCL